MGLVSVLVAMQLTVRLHARRSVGKMLESVPGPLGEAIEAGGDVLAVFSTAKCGACEAQAPTIEILKNQFPSVYTVDIGESSSLARTFGIMATPTTVFIRAGGVSAFLVGLQKPRRSSAPS